MRLILVGDGPGISLLLRHVPAGNVVALIGAVIRPQYLLAGLEEIAAELGRPLLVPPRWGAGEYAGFVRRIAAFRSNLLWVNSYNVILREDARLGSAGRAQHPRGIIAPQRRLQSEPAGDHQWRNRDRCDAARMDGGCRRKANHRPAPGATLLCGYVANGV